VERVGSGKAKIFISYRRRETAGYAGRLYDDLIEHFHAERVFMDVQMEAGVDFSQQINEAVGSCGALIVLIGEDWVTVTDDQGRRRIDDPADGHRPGSTAACG
jgi:TIR domain